ncbi:MAG: choice-of-anchor D domain-containing protein, partial [candidate division Zixibacteria bacterium]|nr:choice-of-anchor D domain-containing protein [candidate division Zixibacteria bacterium]
WDLCIQGEYLWIADYWGDALYKVDTVSGTLLETHASETTDPSGITWDGTYLWYIDNGTTGGDYLYKVDLFGSGTPYIDVSSDSHDFGVVTAGESDTWNLVISNIGTGDLEATGLSFSGTGSANLSTTATFPMTIEPDSQKTIPITWAPPIPGTLDAAATVASNDPINPNYDITLTGDAVSSGPDINLPQASHNYGPVRVGAYTRWMMTIENDGNDVLSILNVSSDDPAFSISGDVTFPVDIAILDSVQIGVWFQPDMDMAFSGNLTISSNDPDENPFVVPLDGSGSGTEWPIGDTLWEYTITGGYDQSPKVIVSIPDINGDGVADVVVGSEDDIIRCFNGNSHGVADLLWEHEIVGGAVYSQKGIDVTGDIDGDSYPDIVIASAWGGKLIRLLSSKDGSEIWTHYTDEYGSGGWVYDVDCSYDYNGDGMADVLAATGDDADDTGPKRIYCLDVMTGNAIWERPIGAPGFAVMGVEDFTGDGQADVLAGASNYDETEGRGFGINGATGIIEWTYQATGSSVWGLAQLDDITGDGIKDVAVGDFSMGGGGVFGLDATDGSEEFGATGLGSVLNIYPMEDVNSDGYHDLLLSHTGVTGLVLSGYDGTYIWSQPLADKAWNVAVCNDLSGDGINDVMIGTLYSNNFCYFLNGTSGEELYSVAFPSAVDALNAIPDITGDESMEMVAGGRNGQLYCFSGGLSTLINNPPDVATINGPSSGNIGTDYEFDFLSVDPDGNDLYYYVDWGDGNTEDWIGPYPSDQKVTVLHSYESTGTFTIKARARDIYDATGPWSDDYLFDVTYMCGDVTDDLTVNVSDAVYIINFVFIGGDPPVPYEAGDANCDGNVNVSDAVHVINYVFIGGNAPCDTNGDDIPDC